MTKLRQLSTGTQFATYPPNCLEFRALCLSFYEDLKLPKSSDAYIEIRNRAYLSKSAWSHPVIRYIASQLPRDFLNMSNESEAFSLFEKVYKEVCWLLKQGHVLPEVKEHLTLVQTSSKKIAELHLKEMRLKLGSRG
ncbi:MAG: hypothetical protein NXI01_09260 [Gammaproteobacteria bacterium]|nr:hypothetical protein [Gammaproteobacteria bacterium]